MFQRLRDALDSRIAEEQARQKAAQESIARSNSLRRPLGGSGGAARNLSPAGRQSTSSSSSVSSRTRRNTGTPVRGPDPAEFDQDEFAIGDDGDSNRTAMSRAETGSGHGGSPQAAPGDAKSALGPMALAAGAADADGTAVEDRPAAAELPLEVRAKLRRLDKFESKYHELLRAYRVAHARVLSIEPFEAALRENTPLTSIGDPKALTEYLGQISLKGDMVLEELKRVSAERDDYKKAADAARVEPSPATGLDNKLTVDTSSAEVADSVKSDIKSPASSTTSRASRIPGISLFAPSKQDGGAAKPLAATQPPESEEFFCFDNEIPRLEAELSQKHEEVETLKSRVESLQRDLSVARESTEGMVRSLEAATRELADLRDAKDRQDTEITSLKHSVSAKESALALLEEKLRLAQLAAQDAQTRQLDLEKQLQARVEAGEQFSNGPPMQGQSGPDTEAPSLPAKVETAGPNKGKNKNKNKNKKNKKKNQSAKPSNQAVSEIIAADSESTVSTTTTTTTTAAAAAAAAQASGSIESLRALLRDKEAAIERLSAKIKGEEDLREEVESLRDDLINLGQENVEAKDQIKALVADKADLEITISRIEKELQDARSSQASNSVDSEKAQAELRAERDSLTFKMAALETDLSAAQQLAATRFKDLTELRETLFQKIQPELRSLRAESAELKTVKESLAAKTAELRTMESKSGDLRVELKSLKSAVAEREAEVKTLNQKIRQETDSRLKAEGALTVAQSDLRYSESKKQEAVEAQEKTVADLARAQEELRSSADRLREMEAQAGRLDRELAALREEIQLKTAQHSSAQSLMNSMRDQTGEMAMQMKEARERCESLEEELAEAHRLLSERSRESETMRQLFSDIEGKTEAKVREYKQRMEAAIEERDRAEEEASSLGRRRAREMEETKLKAREAERALRLAEQSKEDLERAQTDWQRRRDELEAQSEQSTQELGEMRLAISQLRDLLGEREKQILELESDKAELRRSIEEINGRLEKLRKSNKTLSEELHVARQQQQQQQQQQTPEQTVKQRTGSSAAPSSQRSSIDSSSRRARGIGAATAGRSETPPLATAIDYVYLKNVLLQFLEHKDKNYQKQLIPVLGMLLHFDRNDEQRWMAAITK